MPVSLGMSHLGGGSQPLASAVARGRRPLSAAALPSFLTHTTYFPPSPERRRPFHQQPSPRLLPPPPAGPHLLLLKGAGRGVALTAHPRRYPSAMALLISPRPPQSPTWALPGQEDPHSWKPSACSGCGGPPVATPTPSLWGAAASWNRHNPPLTALLRDMAHKLSQFFFLAGGEPGIRPPRHCWQ